MPIEEMKVNEEFESESIIKLDIEDLEWYEVTLLNKETLNSKKYDSEEYFCKIYPMEDQLMEKILKFIILGLFGKKSSLGFDFLLKLMDNPISAVKIVDWLLFYSGISLNNKHEFNSNLSNVPIPSNFNLDLVFGFLENLFSKGKFQTILIDGFYDPIIGIHLEVSVLVINSKIL